MSYPNALSASRSSGFLSPGGKKTRVRREPSGVFSLFQPLQVQQFKEAFSLVDQDGDGIVTEPDLLAMFGSLGIVPSKKMLDDLLNARPGQGAGAFNEGKTKGVNFTMFLTMMGEHLLELDSEAELLEAFESFDENDDGKVKCDEIRKWLSEVGDRMDHTEIDKLLKGPFTDRQGYFNYREWVKVLRVNADEDEDSDGVKL
ncbi:calcium-binding EF-hand domain-containing protein [Cantharellus anzutake]|uniref:calcium-binding EF-hand domain-containing protein n=1 Tax=Cantharellus anzutake TaxID=1750568 RepID=UPI00190440AF|nr:calcium-binding EF-hand domain-containing protein [Cantharellus anzutake]KAF8338023.1 calcium-binding EF-hand domain-containing protein [Cantharellus anzutake]